MDVSIIIVNWNTREPLRNCIRSIYEQSGKVQFEIVMVDNASSDGSAEIVRTEFPQVTLIENSENKGFAAANNQGMAVAKGRYVLLLNSDTVVLDNAISKTVQFADTHPEAAIIGCRVLNYDKTLQASCFMFPSVLNMLLSASYLYKLFPNNKFFGREQMTWWDRRTARKVDVVTGCFMLVQRKAIDQVGKMDEQFFLYGEETDWCYRFRNAGWSILFTPHAEIIHLGGQSSKKVAPDMALQLRASILQFIEKHRSRFEYILAYIMMLCFFAIRVPIWWLLFITAEVDRNYNRMRLGVYLTGMKRLMFNGPKSLSIQTRNSKS